MGTKQGLTVVGIFNHIHLHSVIGTKITAFPDASNDVYQLDLQGEMINTLVVVLCGKLQKSRTAAEPQSIQRIHKLWVGVRVTRKIHVGYFGFFEIRVFKNAARSLL